jgi:small ligand-binding sensory domain FIST
MRFVSVSSRQRSAVKAAADLVRQIRAQWLSDGEEPDLIIFFPTPEFARANDRIVETLQNAWPESLIIGSTAAGILHSSVRPSARPGIVAVAASLPGVIMAPFQMDLDDFEQQPTCLENWQQLLEMIPDPQLIMVFADPFTTPVSEILESLRMLAPTVPVVGGLASGARRPGGHILYDGESKQRTGLVGVALAGNLRADVMVSQGCRPIGNLLQITKAQGNVVQELNGNPAMDALQDMVVDLSLEEKQLVQDGLMFGQAIQNPSEGFSRGDFLIRPVVGVDHKSGAIALAGEVKSGGPIRFHIWDDTLTDDLQLLLVPQLWDTPAAGGFLFGSWPRGGGKQSRLGISIRQITQSLGNTVPIGGFVSAGEIGPIRGRNYLHMHSATLALLRPAVAQIPKPDFKNAAERMN